MTDVPPQPPEDQLRGCSGLVNGLLLAWLLWAGIILLLLWQY